jgi:hypothetical protein
VYSVVTAYLLWLFFGFLGGHRFYLGKVGTGILYALTGGGFFFGWLIDFFRMPYLVRDANLRLRYQNELFGRSPKPVGSAPRQRETIEHAILRIARANRGTVTPAQVAVESEWTLEQAQKALEKLAAGGHADMRIRDSGVIEYRFVEFEREA